MAFRDRNEVSERKYHSIQVGNNDPRYDNPECIKVNLNSAACMCLNALTGKIFVVKGVIALNFYEIMAWSEYFVHENVQTAIVMPSGSNPITVITNPL